MRKFGQCLYYVRSARWLLFVVYKYGAVCSPTQSQQGCQQEMKIKFGRQTIFVLKPIDEGTC